MDFIHLCSCDKKNIIISDILKTVDYVDQTDGTIVFRTCDTEKDKVVLQLGTCDAERALKVAKLV